MSEFWWGLLWLSLFIPTMFLWVFALWDLFGRRDLSGWTIALWAISIVLLPIIGMLFYFISRPKGPDGFDGYRYGSSYASYPEGSGYPYPSPYQRPCGQASSAYDIDPTNPNGGERDAS